MIVDDSLDEAELEDADDDVWGLEERNNTNNDNISDMEAGKIYKVNSALDNIKLKERTESEKKAFDKRISEQEEQKIPNDEKEIESSDDNKTV